MINEQERRYKKVVDKMKSLKAIVDDESAPAYKRNQAAAKYLDMERKYFPKIIHSGNTTYRKPKETANE